MNLSLGESLLISALHDEEGLIMQQAMPHIKSGLIASLLIEMKIKGMITYDGDHLVALGAVSAENHEMIALIWQHIHHRKEERDIKAWIVFLSSFYPKYDKELLDKLVEKKLLEKETNTFLWVFTKDFYNKLNEELCFRPEKRIQKVLDDLLKPSLEDLILFQLMDCSGVNKELFSEPQEAFIAQRHYDELKNLFLQDCEPEESEVLKFAEKVCSSVNSSPEKSPHIEVAVEV